MADAIEADVEITEAQLVEAQLAYADQRGHIKSTRKLALSVLGVSALAIAASWPPTPGVWTAMVAVLLASLYLVRYQWAWMGRRAFAALPELRRRYRVTFDEEGVHEVGPKASVRFGWQVVSGWLETDDLLVLTSAAGVAGSWAKSAFDAEQLLRLRAMLDEHITPPPTPEPAAQKKGSNMKTLVLWVLLVAAFVAIHRLVVSGS